MLSLYTLAKICSREKIVTLAFVIRCHDHIRRITVMWSNVSTHAWNAFSEISIRALLLLFLFTLHAKFEPHKHYITEAEMHPSYRRPRRDSRVTFQTVLALIIFLPLLIITSQMLLRNYSRALRGLLGWNLALIVNAVATESLKLAVGRPRPDFFYRCFPDGVVTSDRRCTGDELDVTDGRKSFPSGHSSFAFCSLGFLFLWLRWRLRMHRYSPRVAYPAYALPFVMASVISASRICDHRHHWQDVVAGAALGLSIAYLSYARYHDPPSRQPSPDRLAASSSVDSDLLPGFRL